MLKPALNSSRIVHQGRAGLVACAIGIAVVTAACGGGGSTSTAPSGATTVDANGLPAPEGVLRVLAREGYTEDSWITPFEKQTGCKVTVHYMGPGDNTASLLAQGSYDVVSVASEDVPELTVARVIRPLDTHLIPHLRTLRPALRAIPALNRGGVVLGVPFQWGPDLLIWNPRIVKQPPVSWNALYLKRWSGRVAIPDDPIQIADAALLAGAQHPSLHIRSPFQLSERQLRAALKLLGRQKALTPARWGAASDEVGAFVNGATVLGAGWSYVVRELRKQGIGAQSEIPLEGATAWLDAWSLVSTATHPGCAYRFLDYTTKASVQAKTARLVGAAPASPGACTLLGMSVCRSLGYVTVADLQRLVFRTTPGLSCPGGQRCTSAVRWSAVWNRLWR
jgi:putative spermidine/putrescine transport system substrate-binding protein